MSSNRDAIVYTLQQSVRAGVQSIIFASWAYVLTVYGWSFWELINGDRTTTLELFFGGDPRSGWLGALAAIGGFRIGIQSVLTFLTVCIPFMLKRRRLQAIERRGLGQ